MIYQLRLPAETGLDGLFQRIVKALELNLGRPLAPDLRADVAADLEKHILAFDTCGNSSLCDEATVPAPWNEGYEDYLLSSNPLDQAKVLRFHLQLPSHSLPDFAGSLARYVDQHLPHSDGSHRSQAAQAVAQILAPYLFVGEICRKTDLCNSAEPRPVKINLEETR